MVSRYVIFRFYLKPTQLWHKSFLFFKIKNTDPEYPIRVEHMSCIYFCPTHASHEHNNHFEVFMLRRPWQTNVKLFSLFLQIIISLNANALSVLLFVCSFSFCVHLNLRYSNYGSSHFALYSVYTTYTVISLICQLPVMWQCISKLFKAFNYWLRWMINKAILMFLSSNCVEI